MQIELQTFGLRAHTGYPASMPQFHRHHEVELNCIEAGRCDYLFGGTYTVLEAGQFALFWAAVPHQMVRADLGTIYHWLTLPLNLFLQWRLPEALIAPVFAGMPLLDQAQPVLDQLLFRGWRADLATAEAERRAIVLLEVEARLRRLALTLTPDQPRPPRMAPSGSLAHAERMARWIAEHYTEPLRVADIAAAAGLQPSQAMAVFRRTFGVSLGSYLMQQRVAHAQRLLLTTNLDMLTIAFDAGFGSASNFYAVFKQVCGQPPRSYRAALREPV